MAQHLRPAQNLPGGGPAAQPPVVATAGRLTHKSSFVIINYTVQSGCEQNYLHIDIFPLSYIQNRKHVTCKHPLSPLPPAVCGASAAP